MVDRVKVRRDGLLTIVEPFDGAGSHEPPSTADVRGLLAEAKTAVLLRGFSIKGPEHCNAAMEVWSFQPLLKGQLSATSDTQARNLQRVFRGQTPLFDAPNPEVPGIQGPH